MNNYLAWFLSKTDRHIPKTNLRSEHNNGAAGSTGQQTARGAHPQSDLHSVDLEVVPPVHHVHNSIFSGEQTDRQTESNAYEPMMQLAQVGSKILWSFDVTPKGFNTYTYGKLFPIKMETRTMDTFLVQFLHVIWTRDGRPGKPHRHKNILS